MSGVQLAEGGMQAGGWLPRYGVLALLEQGLQMVKVLGGARQTLHLRDKVVQAIHFSVSFSADNLTFSSSAIKELGGDGILELDGSNSSGGAFYNESMEFDQSFASFFTVCASDWNGTLAFVLVPSSNETELSKARETVSIEFNTSACSDAATSGAAGGWEGIQVSAYANKSSLSIDDEKSPLDPSQGSHLFSCPWPNYPQCEILLVAYDAMNNTVFVAIHPPPYPYNYMNFTLNLSSIDSAKPLYVGFIVSSGAYYNLSQWNFTAFDSSTGYLDTILPQPPPQIHGGNNPANTPDQTNYPSAAAGGSASGSYKLSAGYVVTFSVLGAAIGVALVACVWLLCRRLPARRSSSPAAARQLRSNNPPHNAAFFDAAKFQPRPPPPSAQNHNDTPNLGSDRDTTPLNPASSFQVSITPSSWLKPVTAR